MTETKPQIPTMEEYVKNQIQVYHDETIRCKTLKETTNDKKPIDRANFWDWIHSIYAEFENVYRLLDSIMNSNRYSISISKNILGLDQLATSEEISKRSKEFGELVDILVKKKKDWGSEEKEKLAKNFE